MIRNPVCKTFSLRDLLEYIQTVMLPADSSHPTDSIKKNYYTTSYGNIKKRPSYNDLAQLASGNRK